MAYVLVQDLTDEYIQALIKRCGYTDVTAQFPDNQPTYAIEDLEGQVTQFYAMDSARRWLIEQYQLTEPFNNGIDTLPDQAYPDGTVVCPNTSNQLTQCTHDNCPFALVYTERSIVSSGSVMVRTAFDLNPRTHVVSDGRGGVRAAGTGESAYVLGYTTGTTTNAQVDIIIKSFFGVVA